MGLESSAAKNIQKADMAQNQMDTQAVNIKKALSPIKCDLYNYYFKKNVAEVMGGSENVFGFFCKCIDTKIP